MKAQIRKNQKDWHIYIFWIILGAFALLFIMDAFSGNEFDQLPLVLCLLPLAILQSRPYQITDRDMLYGNGQIDVKLISRLECCGNEVVVYYSRMKGASKDVPLFIRQTRKNLFRYYNKLIPI